MAHATPKLDSTFCPVYVPERQLSEQKRSPGALRCDSGDCRARQHGTHQPAAARAPAERRRGKARAGRGVRPPRVAPVAEGAGGAGAVAQIAVAVSVPSAAHRGPGRRDAVTRSPAETRGLFRPERASAGSAVPVMTTMTTMTDNPMNDSGSDDGPMRLGDEGPAAQKGSKNGKGRDDSDDGGFESVTHFMDDVFGEWLTVDDAREMSLQDLTNWSEVRRRLLRLMPQRSVCATRSPSGQQAAPVPPHASRGLTWSMVPLYRRSSVWT